MAKIEEKIWRIKIKRQISSRRKEISMLAEKGTGIDNGKLNRKKKRMILKTLKWKISKI